MVKSNESSKLDSSGRKETKELAKRIYSQAKVLIQKEPGQATSTMVLTFCVVAGDEALLRVGTR